MSRPTLGMLVAALLAIGSLVGTVSAQTTTCPNTQTITTGSIVSGSYTDLCAIDGAKETLKEGAPNGKSRLRAFWVIPNVPPGDNSINFWGTRPTNSEGDDFQFGYNTTGQIIYQSIDGAIINKPFAPDGGITIPLLHTTQTTTFYLALWDTNNNGPILDTVTLDAVRIITTP
ncbi:MAG TPA: hypothetical protein VEU09_04250 [Candidatus Binatia bacterium]|nr:hypothetical protein [Candidatus Binatia bacterium]